MNPIRIAIFASGGGSNAKTILKHFEGSDIAEVVLLLSNNAQSGVFAFGPDWNVPTQLLNKGEYQDAAYLIDILQKYEVDLIVLAGYLKLIPKGLVTAFENRIINIHPALLPAYGGKGMYGMNVHKSVIANEEAYSGISIHYVNEVYDDGEILFQERVKIQENWSPEVLQKAVQRLEHQYFSSIIEKVCLGLQRESNNS